MPALKYRKKPVVIDAMPWDGSAEGATAAIDWITAGGGTARYHDGRPAIAISTLGGPITASPGDYVIRGVQGEFYPCKPDIFATTYEAVDPDPRKILALPMGDNDAGAATIGGYLAELAALVVQEDENFSGKRPFGNSGWSGELYRPLIAAGFVAGKLDEDGYIDEIDSRAADTLLIAAARAMGQVNV